MGKSSDRALGSRNVALGFAHGSSSLSGPFVFMKRPACSAGTLTLLCSVSASDSPRGCRPSHAVSLLQSVFTMVWGTAACDAVCSSRYVPEFQYLAVGGNRFL